MTRFIVVRHGQTEWNVEARIQGQGDSNLTAEGRAQARAIAARLAAQPFDVLVSSDLGRAAETARAIAERCGKPIVLDARLRERHFGVGEGMTYEEVDSALSGRLRPHPQRRSRLRSRAARAGASSTSAWYRQWIPSRGPTTARRSWS
jgi:broad specificity phosphatase PhoE